MNIRRFEQSECFEFSRTGDQIHECTLYKRKKRYILKKGICVGGVRVLSGGC